MAEDESETEFIEINPGGFHASTSVTNHLAHYAEKDKNVFFGEGNKVYLSLTEKQTTDDIDLNDVPYSEKIDIAIGVTPEGKEKRIR